ncbi:FmdB family transcriptional regulator [Rubrivivax gelatinosus]|uniref:FmdB family transcriptional regulator n=1 Tax=Rubrivivax gelatinosus TaxID=28068 RepID=A0ABS1E1C1_RUBGE|nr:zinc ribbon domain-containing protein [Rubrivivax gelatinosus]MBK1615355.1 FmdB family transcriptional regulator [Rubrivivax gelatinosus]MBK1715643.1 FmdB family transcriptional regulator [Rubrivivax gelatinosus]
MPIYDYRCPACNADFELLVRSSTVPQCPQCGATELERQLSRIAPAGTSAGIIKRARQAAAREGHFSNYSAGERAKLLK